MEPRLLNEVESLKVEILTLKVQILGEQKKAVEYQQIIVGIRKENLDLKEQLLEAENDDVLTGFGVVGNNKITKMEDGKYKVEPQNEQVKS